MTVDDRGLLRVGPGSAGADPGPVCYGRGGTRPTVTDADLLVGYLDPERFWGGRLRLDESAAREAFRRHVAEPLGVDVGAGRLRRPSGGERQHGGRHPGGLRAARPRPARVRAGGSRRRGPHPRLRHRPGSWTLD